MSFQTQQVNKEAVSTALWPRNIFQSSSSVSNSRQGRQEIAAVKRNQTHQVNKRLWTSRCNLVVVRQESANNLVALTAATTVTRVQARWKKSQAAPDHRTRTFSHSNSKKLAMAMSSKTYFCGSVPRGHMSTSRWPCRCFS